MLLSPLIDVHLPPWQIVEEESFDLQICRSSKLHTSTTIPWPQGYIVATATVPFFTAALTSVCLVWQSLLCCRVCNSCASPRHDHDHYRNDDRAGDQRRDSEAHAQRNCYVCVGGVRGRRCSAISVILRLQLQRMLNLKHRMAYKIKSAG